MSHTIQLPHGPMALLPDGRAITPGTEVTVPGEGRFVFRHVHLPDGSLTCYGPVNKDPNAHRSTRSFRPDAVTVVHRKAASRG